MIKGEKIILTSLRDDDCAALFKWINEPETVRYSSVFTPVNEIDHHNWFENVRKDPNRIIFAIRNLDSPEILGTVQLINIHAVFRSAELVIRIGEDEECGQGAGSEAVRLTVEYAFKDRNLQRVWLHVFADNMRAIKAYRNAGLKQEGILRRACYIFGEWKDLVVMAILDTDNSPGRNDGK